MKRAYLIITGTELSFQSHQTFNIRALSIHYEDIWNRSINDEITSQDTKQEYWKKHSLTQINH